MRGRRVSVALVSGAALASLAGAQIDNGLPGPQPLDAGALALNRQLLRGIMDNNQRSIDRGARQKGEPAGGYLVYRRDPAVTKRVERDYLARAQRAYGPKVADGLRQLLATNDFVTLWAKGAASDGMRPGDLGDSIAEYWSTSWAIVHGHPTTAAQTRAIRYQLGPIVASNPKVRAMIDAQKQAFSESLMLNLVVESIGAQAAQKKGDPALAEKARVQTAARFRQEFGVDLNALNVTNRGLVKA